MKTFHLILICVLEMVVLTMADYQLGYTISSYTSSNTLYDGSCCGGDCTADCRTTLRLCFRDPGHSHTDVDSDCAEVVNRHNTMFFSQNAKFGDSIEEYYPQTFQIYVRVSHSLNEDPFLADFDPPFTDPLIDNIFIEANVEAVTFNALTVNGETYIVTGEFGVATLTLAVNIRCAPNYFGDNCEMLCESEGNNCSTVLTAPPPTTMASTMMSSTDSDMPDTTNQPSPPVTGGPLVPTEAPKIVPIIVGILVALAILVVIAVIIIVLIVCVLRKNKKGSWNPRRNTQPHFTLERAERNLTTNIDRFSVISDNGEEVEYAIVNKPKSPGLPRDKSTPTPPPPYSPDYQDESDDDTPETEPAKDFLVQNKEVNTSFGGYETVDYGPPTTHGNDVRYASLDIHKGKNGVGTVKMEFEAEQDGGNDEEPIQYTIVKHQDS